MSHKRMRSERVKYPFSIDDEPPEEKDLINGLSDDCLAKIFTFIPPQDRLLMKLGEFFYLLNKKKNFFFS